MTSFHMFWREQENMNARSATPTRSGVTSTSVAPGTALRTSAIALRTAARADSALRVKSRPSRPGRPMPIKASSHSCP